MLYDNNEKITVAGEFITKQFNSIILDYNIFSKFHRYLTVVKFAGVIILYSDRVKTVLFFRNRFLGHWVWSSKTPWSIHEGRQIPRMDNEKHKGQLPLYKLNLNIQLSRLL